MSILGDWDVHWGYIFLTHSHVSFFEPQEQQVAAEQADRRVVCAEELLPGASRRLFGAVRI